MDDCIFCKIVKKEIPSDIIYEDDEAISFNDINPQAPTHFLIVPKKHIPNIGEVTESDKDLVSHLFSIANALAREKNVAESGFRIVINCNDDGGQTVNHLHIHLLGGRFMKWPPG